MAISNYSELKTEMASRSARSDLSTNLDNMIVLAEARMLRDLKRSHELQLTTSLAVDAQSEDLPSDFAGMVRIRIGTDHPPLDYLPPDSFWSRYAADYTGRPIMYTIEANKIYFGPIPEETYTATYTYIEQLDIATDTTNRLLSIYPDIYLWACMVELADFIHDENMIAKYEARYMAAKEAMLEADQAIGTPSYISDVP